MSEFMAFLEPPGSAIDHYDCNKPHSQQSPGIPEKFLEVMSVREEVFVKEFKAPLNLEHDSIDRSSYHWIVYASVGTKRPSLSDSAGQSGPPGASSRSVPPSGPSVSRGFKQGQASTDTTANKLAVGCVRLIVPPHGIEPCNPNVKPRTSADNENFPTSRDEPYVKLSRMAILKPFRGIGLSRLLLNGACEWATHNPERIVPPLHPTIAEQRRIEGHHNGDQESWKGLVLVHALTSAMTFWEAQGFIKDDSMGEWIEDEMTHVGMWKRLKLQDKEKTSASSSVSSLHGIL